MSDIIKEETARSIYNIVMGFVPGSHVMTELADVKGRIQTERVNKFAEFLKEGFESVNESFDAENLKSEDFLDSFELIIRKVVNTKSEAKLKRYRNVLLRNMFSHDSISEMFLKYVSLAENVNDIQVLIIDVMEKQPRRTYLQIIRLLQEGKESTNDENAEETQNVTLFNGQTISFDELRFLIHDLKVLGVFHTTTLSTYGGVVEYNEINQVGKGFLRFIREYGPDDK
jgi:hypothetical protein